MQPCASLIYTDSMTSELLELVISTAAICVFDQTRADSSLPTSSHYCTSSCSEVSNPVNLRKVAPSVPFLSSIVFP